MDTKATEQLGRKIAETEFRPKCPPCGIHIAILPVPCGVPVVLGVVEPAVVGVGAEVVGAWSVAVVGAAIAVGVDGVVLNEQQTKLLDKKILNCLLKIKSIHRRFHLPE